MVVEAIKEKWFGLKKDPPIILDPGTTLLLRKEDHDLPDYIISPYLRLVANITDEHTIARDSIYSPGVGGARMPSGGRSVETKVFKREQINSPKANLSTKRTITGSRTVLRWRP